MKFESSVTAVSWIPFEAVKGFLAMPFDMGLAHYDEPLPARLDDLDAWHKQDLFREANELHGWIEVEDGKITGYGQSGSGRIGVTRLKLGPKTVTVKAKAMPDMRPEPEVTDTYVRFKQTCGGRTGVPAPRPVSRKPFLQIDSAVAWTTLSLTIHSDGRSEYELCGASAFPRHWVYDHSGKLVKETGVTDFTTWINDAFGERTPWGAYDSPALVKQVESDLERELSQVVLNNAKPKRRSLAKGKTLIEQGQPGDELYLVLDGMLAVEVDGKQVAEVGPGAIVGERAIVESGNRTATLRALTPCRVASVPRRYADGTELVEIAAGHRREEAR
ncbi:MAG TPA: cyclic nucleotide-binding domain-containing protein [Candidatus Dormibacteraeota bacterium]|nr:cyclic nucleotide-binding domain-containing protein [Candidatus Dormibacteraeota bacterium]